ncbi:MAG: multifunctional CCA addition/repair protein [Betaproteobacteria bacterium]|nr:multifunctional CCA addition/repair protein [Betaproteobacteria bacterium]MCH9849833.1 multifunctional CCA addition/repair protein [Betaproteobacteria bacterium]
MPEDKPLTVYCVGGAVRDELLKIPTKDRDYVVVGSSADEMLKRGYQAVGKDFPVFLHPKTHEEYALARTERKVSKGYKGFTVHANPDVTLEEDLTRRDFTMNAIAQSADGQLIDPFNGQTDIQNKVIRHVGAAFVEDPVRILRAARFSARFVDFAIAPETMQLMQQMVADGEVDALVAERVWQELAKGLMEEQPSRMFDVLQHCGALPKLIPELSCLWCVPQTEKYHPEIDTGIHVMMALDYAAQHQFSLPVRYAVLMHDLGKGTTPKEVLPRHIGHDVRGAKLVTTVSKRLRVPNECRELAYLVAKFHIKAHQVLVMKAETLLKFLMDLDAIRQPDRFEHFLLACEADSRGRLGLENIALPEADLLRQALHAAMQINAGDIAKNYAKPEDIKQAIFDARLIEVKAIL